MALELMGTQVIPQNLSSEQNLILPISSRYNHKFITETQNNKILIPSHERMVSQLRAKCQQINISQRAEAILNKISNNINKAHTGLISVLQGFQRCIA